MNGRMNTIGERLEDGSELSALEFIPEGVNTAEEELRIQRDSLVNIFSSMRDSVVTVSEGWKIQYRNLSVKKNFGELKEQKCYEYLHNRTNKCPWCVLDRILVEEKMYGEYEANSNNQVFDVMCSPIKNIDGTISMLEIMRDITIRKRAEQEIKNQLAEKELILKETHHRIKNNLASITSLLSLQVNNLTNYGAIAALNDAMGRVKSMQLVYEKLLIAENHDLTSIREYLENLVDEILYLYLNSKKFEIDVVKNIDDFCMDPKRLVSFGIIVNELLTNIMKYAFKEKIKGKISISLKKTINHIILVIQDDGQGLPEGFVLEKDPGFGLMLVRMMTEQLNGSFEIQNLDGTRCILIF